MLWIALLITGQEVSAPTMASRSTAALTLASHAALAFSPMVSQKPPNAVLLDVQASQRYFGGLQALLARLSDTLRGLLVSWQGGVAPTPLAAEWLAREHAQAGQFACAGAQASSPALQTQLASLPVRVLASAQPHAQAFETLGLYTLGHLWRLPRSGVSRRFGPALLHELDRALGLKPDPREPLVLPEHFDERAELWEHTDSAAQLSHATHQLLTHLGVWLLARQALASALELLLWPTPRLKRIGLAHEPQRLRLELAQPSRDVGHLGLLLRERLQRLSLVQPVAALGLRSLRLSAATHADMPGGQLFPAPASAQVSLARLVERLQARLGVDRVQGLALKADHRPERATVPVRLPLVTGRGKALGKGVGKAPESVGLWAAHAHQPRPACLLPTPQALPMRQGQPCVGGQPLRLLAGPERIETGWWGDDELGDEPAWPTQRDYFVAESHTHALLWVFCEPGQGVAGPNGGGASDCASSGGRWFLHGHFG